MKTEMHMAMVEEQGQGESGTGSTPAERALAEAHGRRIKMAGDKEAAAKEIGGPKGLEPTRYGDWEKGGIVSDF